MLFQTKYGEPKKQEVVSIGALVKEGDVYTSVVQLKYTYTEAELLKAKAKHESRIQAEQSKVVNQGKIDNCQACVDEIAALLPEE